MTSSVSALIVVSNRLPFTLVKDKEGRLVRKAAAGGLGTAVAPVVVKSKGQSGVTVHVSRFRGTSLTLHVLYSVKLENTRILFAEEINQNITYVYTVCSKGIRTFM
jgi:hypothetical protein